MNNHNSINFSVSITRQPVSKQSCLKHLGLGFEDNLSGTPWFENVVTNFTDHVECCFN